MTAAPRAAAVTAAASPASPRTRSTPGRSGPAPDLVSTTTSEPSAASSSATALPTEPAPSTRCRDVVMAGNLRRWAGSGEVGADREQLGAEVLVAPVEQLGPADRRGALRGQRRQHVREAGPQVRH